MSVVLEVNNLGKKFGDFEVIRDLSLAVEAGDRHAIIGPNGAGKTTLFNMLSGWVAPSCGSIRVMDRDVTSLQAYELARAGVARSFQRNMLLESLSVMENLRIACQAADKSRRNFLKAAQSFSGPIEKAKSVADQMELTPYLESTVLSLSYGQKRQLEVALSLCTDPHILLLDEPAAGMSPTEREILLSLIARLPQSLTIILVEHDMDVVYAVCDTITVLNYGQVLATGDRDTVRNDPAVVAAYLGEAYA